MLATVLKPIAPGLQNICSLFLLGSSLDPAQSFYMLTNLFPDEHCYPESSRLLLLPS